MVQHILDMSLELGKLIKQSEAFKQLQAKEAVMLQDDNAQKLLADYQKIQLTYQQKQMQGQKLTPEDIKAFEEMELKLLENHYIKDFVKAKGVLEDLLKSVNETINKAMLGGKTSQEAEASCPPPSCGC